MAWWREARFGMFIHWGIYAVPAGMYRDRVVDPKHGSEWIQCDAPIPADEYARYADRFNPVKFDARQWVRLAKDAGMKYIVITSKHHDGFCLYDTAATDYDIVDATPYKKDPLAELARACKEQGVRLGFYYSQLDWHHPALMLNPKLEGKKAYRFNAVRDGRKGEYVAYVKTQLRELITRYDSAVLFFDGEWTDWWTAEDGKDLTQYIRGLKADVVINNRVGKRKPEDGDYGTPEQRIPDTGLGYDWETCMTMNGTWGYKSYDNDWKSVEDLLRKLVDIASKGGNFLLNVGPTAEGLIPAPSAKRLEGMGRWLKVNGESIYGTSASPLPRPAWGRLTAKDNRLYLHVFDWPAGPLKLEGLATPVHKAWLLGDAKQTALAFKQSGRTVSIEAGDKAPDAVDTVVVLELDGPAKPADRIEAKRR